MELVEEVTIEEAGEMEDRIGGSVGRRDGRRRSDEGREGLCE